MATQTLTTSQAMSAPKPAAAPPADRIRTYKDFLTPALHRRFTHAAAALLVLCLIDAYLFSTTNHFIWSWFPLGPAGIRALMLFISCLAVFVVRVGGLHVGERTTTSAVETLVGQVAGAKGTSSTLFLLGGYVLSAWWYGEVFLWSRDETAALAMLLPSQTYERPRLNENPIFLRCLYPTIALVQASLHFARDYDRARIPAADVDEAPQNELARLLGQDQQAFARLPPSFRVLTERFITLLRHVIETSFVGILIGFIAYMTVLRQSVWKWSYSFARPLVHELAPSAPPSGFYGWRLPVQTVYSVVVLITLWEVSNAVFDAIVAQKPLKKGQPLTSEVKDARGVILHKSKDPNGSLLSGLESKREVNKSFAFWELYLICTEFDIRRRTIYAEVDRKGGSTWSRICTSSIQQLEDIKKRIAAVNEPVDYQKKQAELQQQKQHHQNLIGYDKEEPLGLKKIADQGVKNDGDVFAKRKPDFANYVGDMAKSIGQSPGAEDPVTARARKALQWGTDQMLSQEERQRLSPENLQQQAGGYLNQLLKTPLGIPFRKPFARQLKAVIFGAPHSNRVNIVHAVKSLVKLTVCSLQEDNLGQVQKDIARVVRTLTETIAAVEKFVKELQPSWTDVTFTEPNRKVEEVDDLVDVLKTGLEEIMLRFGEYTSALGLSKKEVREAKEAAAKAQHHLQQQQNQQQLPPPPPTRQPLQQPEMRQVGGSTRQRRLYN